MASKGDINKYKIQPSYPNRWSLVRYDEILEKTKIDVKLKSKDISCVGIYPVVDQGTQLIAGYVDDENSLYTGNLPVVIFGDHTKNIKYIDFKFAVGADGTKLLKPKKGISERFLYYNLLSLRLPDFGYSRHFSVFKTLDFPLPPLPEQERIVAKLDKLFAQHEKIKKALDRIPQLLKTFRQQVLTQAVTGKLTEQWREGKELEDFDQLVCRIINNRNEEYQKSIALAQQKGERKPSKAFLFEKPTIDEIQIKLPQTWGQTNIHFLAYVTKLAGFEYTNHFKVTENGDIPIVRAQNVQMGKFEDKNRLYISKEVSDFLVRSQLHGRELLMVFIGAGTGNVCLAPDNERWHLAPNVAKIDFDFVDRKYMFYYLQSDLGVKNVLSRVKATAQPSLSMETIREIVTIVPPIDEQQEIVRRVESLFAKADAIEARYQALKAKIDNLPQAILHKAFKGELVPQLPTDGDAKDLLAEIMALNEETKGKRNKT